MPVGPLRRSVVSAVLLVAARGLANTAALDVAGRDSAVCVSSVMRLFAMLSGLFIIEPSRSPPASLSVRMVLLRTKAPCNRSLSEAASLRFATLGDIFFSSV